MDPYPSRPRPLLPVTEAMERAWTQSAQRAAPPKFVPDDQCMVPQQQHWALPPLSSLPLGAAVVPPPSPPATVPPTSNRSSFSCGPAAGLPLPLPLPRPYHPQPCPSQPGIWPETQAALPTTTPMVAAFFPSTALLETGPTSAPIMAATAREGPYVPSIAPREPGPVFAPTMLSNALESPPTAAAPPGLLTSGSNTNRGKVSWDTDTPMVMDADDTMATTSPFPLPRNLAPPEPSVIELASQDPTFLNPIGIGDVLGTRKLRRTSWLLRLPARAWAVISQYLSYHEVLELSRLSRLFHGVRLERFWPVGARFEFVLNRELSPLIHGLSPDWLACYHCFSIKPPDRFQAVSGGGGGGTPERLAQHSHALVMARNPATGSRAFQPLPRHLGEMLREVEETWWDMAALLGGPPSLPSSSPLSGLDSSSATFGLVETLRRYCLECGLSGNLTRPGDQIQLVTGDMGWVCYCRKLHAHGTKLRCRCHLNEATTYRLMSTLPGWTQLQPHQC